MAGVDGVDVDGELDVVEAGAVFTEVVTGLEAVEVEAVAEDVAVGVPLDVVGPGVGVLLSEVTTWFDLESLASPELSFDSF